MYCIQYIVYIINNSVKYILSLYAYSSWSWKGNPSCKLAPFVLRSLPVVEVAFEGSGHILHAVHTHR